MFKKVRNPFRERRNENSSSSGFFTKSSFNELTSNMDSIMKACGKIPNLNNSPPYILSILPDIHTILHKIVTEHDRDFHALADNDYFQVSAFNLAEKCRELKRILKNDPSSHHILKSSVRRELSKYSLVFSHILHELNAFFSNGTFTGGRFKITKSEAKAFWEQNFGAQAIINWQVFKRELTKVHQIDNSIDLERALQETIQLTKSQYVSKFEFDVFTRLFQPWPQLLVNWKVLAVTHPGYSAFITYEELHEELQPHSKRDSVGAYAFRLSNTKLGQWAIGYVNQSGEILQTIPENKSLMKVLIDGERNGYYTKPKGRAENPDLTRYLHETKPENIEVPEESVQIYFDMGTTFNLCKVCLDRDKDIRIEPCNHLVCADCVAKWKVKDNSPTPTCPFCRCDIRDTTPICLDNDKSSTKPQETNRPLPPIPVDPPCIPPSSDPDDDLYMNEFDDEPTPPPVAPCPPVRNSLMGAENPAFEYHLLSPETQRSSSTSNQNINSAGIAAPPIPPRKLS